MVTVMSVSGSDVSIAHGVVRRRVALSDGVKVRMTSTAARGDLNAFHESLVDVYMRLPVWQALQWLAEMNLLLHHVRPLDEFTAASGWTGPCEDPAPVDTVPQGQLVGISASGSLVTWLTVWRACEAHACFSGLRGQLDEALAGHFPISWAAIKHFRI